MRGRSQAVARRGEVIRIGGVTIVDDSYNSNPKALSGAIGMMRVMSGDARHQRRIVVIGEMLELGRTSEACIARPGGRRRKPASTR